jgi:hypothetical protein
MRLQIAGASVVLVLLLAACGYNSPSAQETPASLNSQQTSNSIFAPCAPPTATAVSVPFGLPTQTVDVARTIATIEAGGPFAYEQILQLAMEIKSFVDSKRPKGEQTTVDERLGFYELEIEYYGKLEGIEVREWQGWVAWIWEENVGLYMQDPYVHDFPTRWYWLDSHEVDVVLSNIPKGEAEGLRIGSKVRIYGVISRIDYSNGVILLTDVKLTSIQDQSTQSQLLAARYDPKSLVITLERTMCLGNCPVYKVRVW